MDYNCAVVFHKKTNLMPYFEANVNPTEPRFGGNMEYSERYAQIERRYGKERDVRLILLVRFEREHNVRTICKIHCPVSPLPVKGEFEAPSVRAITDFLTNNGWHKTEVLARHLLK